MYNFVYAFTKYFARINGVDVDIEFFNGTDFGFSRKGLVGINKEHSIPNPYNSYGQTLQTIFHEVFHELQRVENENNMYNLGRTIEKILSNNNGKYYDSNYEGIFYEIDARYYSYNVFLNYLRDIAPDKYTEYLEEYSSKINDEIINYETNNNKYVNGDITLNRDSALESIIKNNTKLLDEYPILKYIFNSDGSRKTLFELADIYNEHINDKSTRIIDMISYWVRNSSYSLESITREYYELYVNGIESLPSEFREMINNQNSEELTEELNEQNENEDTRN